MFPSLEGAGYHSYFVYNTLEIVCIPADNLSLGHLLQIESSFLVWGLPLT